MDELLGSDAVLAVPTAPGPAPILNTPQNKLATYRKNMLSLTSIAGLAGLPQVLHHYLGLLGETAHPIAAAISYESAKHALPRTCSRLQVTID